MTHRASAVVFQEPEWRPSRSRGWNHAECCGIGSLQDMMFMESPETGKTVAGLFDAWNDGCMGLWGDVRNGCKSIVEYVYIYQMDIIAF